ncbi:KilA-N domain-containing protein [Pedobacter rhizosphaerae]|uniref:KilA-N domain-containing protein n=1 Tax=Pedobacter rhizosphaerae TaxID=390241 RepID=A0A1H9RL33_9SPHI|nr:KilA-N domain-containing protein [Pedobacter rhizosphaerae]SER73482.1 KilA-N domain-containing protein [Pedobacter rhizosphaerae]
MSKINLKGVEISIVAKNDQDYICLTDMVKGEEGVDHIKNWMRNRNTVEFLGIWEKLYNPDFKGVEFDTFRKEAGLNNFTLTPKKWIDATGAIGIISKSGKYGGTYAHKDIAFEFGTWISPEFKLLLIQEFQRLKDFESKQLNQAWDVRRVLTKANYRVQTDAIKDVLIPAKNLPKDKEGFLYATEADLLNQAMYGYTAKQWKENNPQLALNGENMRDYATVHQLIVLNGLEVVNAELIRANMSIDDRFKILRRSAIQQLKSLQSSKSIEDADAESPNMLRAIVHKKEDPKK